MTAPAAGGTAPAGPAAGPGIPLPGTPFPLGATPRRDGTNFAVASGIPDRVNLCLFGEDGAETTRVSLRDFDAGIWHGFLPGIGVGQAYGAAGSPAPRGPEDKGQAHGRPPLGRGAAQPPASRG